MITRRGIDWTARYPWPTAAAAKLPAERCTIDGELVVAGEDGISDFDKLHSRCFDGHAFLYAFDLMEIDGEDLRRRPLGERKAMLAKLLRRAGRRAPGRARRRRRRRAVQSRMPYGLGRHRLQTGQ